jgi:nicotinate-nucleotide adenylyltransferase
MRIGIFGGTFNPIHYGHLRSAEEVREAQEFDRVLFVPAATPPHKGRAELAAAEQRFAMVRRAVAGHPHFRASRIEIDRPGRSYSVDTLDALRRRHPAARLGFILGLDAFREIGTWKEPERLFGLCDVIVTSRPPHREVDLLAAIPVVARGEFRYNRAGNALTHESGHRVIFQRISDLAISATSIRQLRRSGHSIRYLVPASVERHIEREQLYARRIGTH